MNRRSDRHIPDFRKAAGEIPALGFENDLADNVDFERKLDVGNGVGMT